MLPKDFKVVKTREHKNEFGQIFIIGIDEGGNEEYLKTKLYKSITEEQVKAINARSKKKVWTSSHYGSTGSSTEIYKQISKEK